MASIGPTLPPHLANRKRMRDAEDDDSNEPSVNPPQPKRRASDSAQPNTDEIDLESDSDDGYGPSVPAATRPSKGPAMPPSIGPTPPPAASIGPSLPPKNADEVALDSDGEEAESIGPSAPPPPLSTSTRDGPARSVGPTLSPTNTEEVPLDGDDDNDDAGPAPPPPAGPPKRTHDPAPPPAPLAQRPQAPADPDSDSDDDDDYGPALPTSTSHQQRQARALAAAEAEAAAAASRGPKRDDWMLAPPTSGGYRAEDPTKLKARKFNSGPRANTDSNGGEIASIWTETPEEKRRRLENAVLGRGNNNNSSSSRAAASSTSKNKGASALSDPDPEQAARIRSFTESTRGKSLYEEHQAARAQGQSGSGSGSASGASKGKKSWVDEEDDDPSKRAFDKEKDMKLGGRIGASQRKELLNKAADFGGRFTKGKYL